MLNPRTFSLYLVARHDTIETVVYSVSGGCNPGFSHDQRAPQT